jgi:glycosyltransferase involved in cell wall biosynthesis
MKLLLFANTDWYLWNFRRSLALALREAGHDVLLLSPDGPYGGKLRALGLRWQPLPMDRRSLNPLREAMLLLHLVRLLRRERPDVVHGFTIKSAVYGSLAARLAGVPARVNAVAGMGYVFVSDAPKARLLRPLVRALMKLALGGRKARLILQNPDDVALFEQARLVDPAHIRLIPGSGVDTTRFAPDPRRVAGARIRVLLPARLLWDKGLAEYVQAARLLHERGVPVDLLLAGDPDPGNPAAVPEATARRWVGEGLLDWLGHVDDMPALLRSVDIVALPSYREGLPKGLIEAAASGCALIATDVPGCREVVEHEVDGLRVPVGVAVALADAIARLARDAGLRARLGAAARAKAIARFDERIVVRDTMAVYRELGAL